MAGTKFDFDEARRVYERLVTVADNAKSEIRYFREQHPRRHRDFDARIAGFAKLSNALASAALGLKFYANQLINPEWWRQYSGEALTSEDKKRINRAYVNFVKVGLVQLGFSATESSLRAFLRTVDPAACTGGTEAFTSMALSPTGACQWS